MNLSVIFRSLGPIDIRNIRRDNMLSWMIFIPVLCALVLRWGVPPLTASLQREYGFDLTPYYPALLAYFLVVMTPIVFAVLIGFLLLDEKDDNTLTALQVTPLSLNSYIAYRVAIPLVLTVGMLFILFPLANLGSLSWAATLVVALAAAPQAPMFALFLAALAQNKVQGFALMKMAGMLLLAPTFAFFVTPGWDLLFGIIPTYWSMKVYWLVNAGQPNVWVYLLVGILYQSAVSWLFLRRFYTVLHQ